MKIEIKDKFTNKVLVSGDYTNIRECLEKNKTAYLGHADLEGIKHYSENHEIFQEIVRRQSMNAFTSLQWSMIGQILIHRLCWESIEKRYGKKFLTVLSKIKKLGFGEYYDRYKEMLCRRRK